MFQPPEEIIDLTLPIDHDTPMWPSFPPVDIELTDIAARDGFTMENVSMRTHTATHVDSPKHFVPGGKSLDDFPIGKYMGEGVVVDLTDVGNAETIRVSDLEPYESELQAGDVVMLDTGWDQYYGHTPEWLFEFPHLAGEASQWLADQDATAVGIDTQSVGGWFDEVPAHGPTTDVHPADSHLPLLENDVIPIEGLGNLDAVRDGADVRRAYFCYTPLDLRDTGGCPVRAFAFL